MVLINLTPHSVTICDELGAPVAIIEPSGQVARVSTRRIHISGNIVSGAAAPVPVFAVTYGTIEGLPAPQSGIGYIVSAIVLARCSGRPDVYSPGELVRNLAGQPVGCIGLTAAEGTI
jgi:hypothetical protein